jgi:hypothetical protein
MRIWNAWSPEPFNKHAADSEPTIQFSQDLWEQIRSCVKNVIDVEDANNIVEKYFETQYGQRRLSIAEDAPRSRQVSFVNP